jgi:hypothetical protein
VNSGDGRNLEQAGNGPSMQEARAALNAVSKWHADDWRAVDFVNDGHIQRLCIWG